jgi:hypothetical protein
MSTSASFVASRNGTRGRLASLWSSDEIRRLREMAARGAPLRLIACALRRTESSIRNKAGMHGISIQTKQVDVESPTA